MDTNETTAVRRGPGRPPKTPDAHEPTITKDMEPAKPSPVVGMEVVLLKPYRPMNPDILAAYDRPAEGVMAKLRPEDGVIELPIEEAKRAIRAGVATFPAQEI